MLPKGLSNHTKFATYFLNMGLTPPPPFLKNFKKNADLVEGGTPKSVSFQGFHKNAPLYVRVFQVYNKIAPPVCPCLYKGLILSVSFQGSDEMLPCVSVSFQGSVLCSPLAAILH